MTTEDFDEIEGRIRGLLIALTTSLTPALPGRGRHPA